MKPVQLVFGLLLTIVCTFTMFWFAGELQTNYGIAETGHLASFDKIEEVFDPLEKAADDIYKLNIEDGTLLEKGIDLFNAGLSLGLVPLRTIYNLFPAAHAMITDVGQILGIPPFLTNTFLVMLLVLIAFIVLTYIVRMPTSD